MVVPPLYECIEEAFGPFRRHSFTDLSLKTKCGAKVRCDFVKSSHIADIPEPKGCLSLKKGVLTTLLCPRCVTPKYDMD